MKAIILLALLLTGCNLNTKQDEPQMIKYGDSIVVSLNSEIFVDSSGFSATVWDSVYGGFEPANDSDSLTTDTNVPPKYIRLLITGSDEDSARLRIKFIDASAIPPQMKRTVAITNVGNFSISFTTENKYFVELAKKYGAVHHAITSDDPQYILFVDARFDLAEVAEYLKHEAGKLNN